MSSRQKKGGKLGFTIVELLVVISVMAVIVTLATGAAIKAIKNNRHKRIETMAKTLEMALVNYRAATGEWPIQFEYDQEKVTTIGGTDNARVFAPLYNAKNSGEIRFLDTGVFMTRYNGTRMNLKQALNQGGEELPLGYPNPDNTDEFKYFRVEYNCKTQTLKVKR